LANPAGFRDFERHVVEDLGASLTILQFSEVSKSNDVDVGEMRREEEEEELEAPVVISVRPSAASPAAVCRIFRFFGISPKENK
jgi:hypothetical protein